MKSYERILCEVRESQKKSKDEFKMVEYSFQVGLSICANRRTSVI